MKWNDDFWKVKNSRKTLNLSGDEAIRLFKQGHQKGINGVTLDLWLKRAKELQTALQSLGYPPRTITIKGIHGRLPTGYVHQVDLKEYLDEATGNRRQVYIMDIYCSIPRNSPVGRALQQENEDPSAYWLRIDYNCEIRHAPTFVVEVLNNGARDFSHSDYWGYIVGNSYGEHTLECLRGNVRIQTYGDAYL